MVKTLQQYTVSLTDVIKKLDNDYYAVVESVISQIITCFSNDCKIMFAGNGGSAADAQHMAGEYVSRFMFDRPGLNAIALTTDTSIITAIGNDYGYEHLFSRQLAAIGRSDDVLIMYTTSGTSPNILSALEKARDLDIHTVLITSQKCRLESTEFLTVLKVPSDSTPTIQEVHLVTGHYICMRVEEAIYG